MCERTDASCLVESRLKFVCGFGLTDDDDDDDHDDDRDHDTASGSRPGQVLIKAGAFFSSRRGMDISRRPLPDAPPLKKSLCLSIDSCCCNSIFILPVGIILGLTLWAAWVQVWEISIGYVGGVWGPLFAAMGLFLAGMSIYCYILSVFRTPGSPVDQSQVYVALPTSESNNPSIMVKENGQARFCQKCNCNKPDRAHHCSVCGKCVLKMDHHCPWIGGCVGYRNQKYFVLWLIYLTWFCLVSCPLCIICLTVWMGKSQYNAATPVSWLLLSILTGVVALVVGGFTAWCIYLVCTNTTTIECLETTRYKGHSSRRELSKERIGNAFDLGRSRNWRQVMGESPLIWFVPTRPQGDGQFFPTNPKVVREIEVRNMEANSFADGFSLQNMNGSRNSEAWDWTER